MTQLPPERALWNLINSNAIARCVQVVAEFGVADVLADHSLTAAELAAQTGMDADALNRMLSLLAAHDVFAREGSGYRQKASSYVRFIETFGHFWKRRERRALRSGHGGSEE